MTTPAMLVAESQINLRRFISLDVADKMDEVRAIFEFVGVEMKAWHPTDM